MSIVFYEDTRTTCIYRGRPRVDRVLRLKRMYKSSYKINIFSFGFVEFWCKKCRRVVCVITAPHLSPLFDRAEKILQSHDCTKHLRTARLKKRALETNIPYKGRGNDIFMSSLEDRTRIEWLGAELLEPDWRGRLPR